MLVKTASLYFLTLLVGVGSADLLRYADQIPQCGVRLFDRTLSTTGKNLLMVTNASLQLSCILQSIPASACQSVSNSTCVCNDANLAAASTSCVLKRCSVEEALSILPLIPDGIRRVAHAGHRSHEGAGRSMPPAETLSPGPSLWLYRRRGFHARLHSGPDVLAVEDSTGLSSGRLPCLRCFCGFLRPTFPHPDGLLAHSPNGSFCSSSSPPLDSMVCLGSAHSVRTRTDMPQRVSSLLVLIFGHLTAIPFRRHSW